MISRRSLVQHLAGITGLPLLSRHCAAFAHAATSLPVGFVYDASCHTLREAAGNTPAEKVYAIEGDAATLWYEMIDRRLGVEFQVLYGLTTPADFHVLRDLARSRGYRALPGTPATESPRFIAWSLVPRHYLIGEPHVFKTV